MFSSDEEDAIGLETKLSSNHYLSLPQEAADGDSNRNKVVLSSKKMTSITNSQHSCDPSEVNGEFSDSDNEIPIFTSPELSKSNNNAKPFYWIISAFAAIGGFLFGYDTGIMSGAMLLLKDEFHLPTFWQELIISITIGTAALAAFVGGFLNDKFGRRSVTLFSSFIFICGALILGVSQNKEMLLIGRSTLGIAIGLSSMTIPMYIAECTPSALRGRLVTLNVLFVTGGQCFASIMAGSFSYLEKDGWRYMLGLAAVPAMIQLVGILFLLPESPRWLMKHGKEEKARAVLVKLRGLSLSHNATNVNEEMDRMKAECEIEQARNTSDFLVLLRILQTPHLRRAVVVGCALQLFQQLSGINTVMYYSATVIKMSGVEDKHEAIWLSAVTAFVNFIFTLLGLYLVEKIGRKKLILFSLTGAAISLVLMAITFHLVDANSPAISEKISNSSSCSSYSSCTGCTADIDCGFCFTGVIGSINGSCLSVADDTDYSLVGPCVKPHASPGLHWAYDYCPSKYSWMAVLGLVLYLMFFAPGMGPMPWAINAEIYPMWARSTGNSLATSVNWGSNLIVSMTFLTLTETITKAGTYWLFVGVCVVALAFITLYLPETKGVSLEEVDQLFMQPWCQCGRTDSSKRKAYSPLHSPSDS